MTDVGRPLLRPGTLGDPATRGGEGLTVPNLLDAAPATPRKEASRPAVRRTLQGDDTVRRASGSVDVP